MTENTDADSLGAALLDLSGGGDRERQARDDPMSGVSAVCGGQIDIRRLRLFGASKAHIVNERVIEDFAH